MAGTRTLNLRAAVVARQPAEVRFPPVYRVALVASSCDPVPGHVLPDAGAGAELELEVSSARATARSRTSIPRAEPPSAGTSTSSAATSTPSSNHDGGKATHA